MLAVIAKIPIKEDYRDRALHEVRNYMNRVAEEAGTLHYTVNVDKEDPNILVFMERYSDRAALKIHGASEHLQAFFDQIRDLLDGEPEVRVMDELASIEPKSEPEDR